jgi:hypothetical protein
MGNNTKSRTRTQRSDIATRKRLNGSKPSVHRFRLPKAYREHSEQGGAYYVGDSLKLLGSKSFERLRGKVQLILTSPPFPLNQKKSYGNKNGYAYLKWFRQLAPLFSDLLAPDGSLVVEIGNSWEPGRPVQSLLTLKSLLALVDNPKTKLRLVQEFVCYNPSRLPSPASWVTVKRIRTVDSFTHVWWIAKKDFPKANNRRVLRPYSEAMKQLIRRGTYNAGKRPSEHTIGKDTFSVRHRGAISHNLFEMEPLDAERQVRLPNAFSLSNTISNDFFSTACKAQDIVPHPARMPPGLAAFFVEFLTDKGDLVLDPFGGSNTTGYVAALKKRRWIAIDANKKYALQSKLRFKDPALRGGGAKNERDG